MPLDYRFSPLRLTDPALALKPSEVRRFRGQKMFNQWVAGATYQQLAERNGMTIDGVRTVLKQYLTQLWVALYKWKIAEARCAALALELNYLRAGQDRPDAPLESIDPPAFWLKAFKAAGIHTVNQLRAVSSDVLTSQWRFPKGAIGWAIVKLDRLGLSHHLVREKPKKQFKPLGREVIER